MPKFSPQHHAILNSLEYPESGFTPVQYAGEVTVLYAMLPGTSDRKFEEQCYNPECDLMFSER
jgi:hypothetical protein